MDGERDCSGAGSARRRRERRQRSWLRHEQLSVKMALSAALHHSCGVRPELHDAPRGPKTDRAVEEEVREVNDALEGQKRPPPGERPAPLPEAAVTVGYVAAEAPSLVVAPVAEHDGLDDATIQYLLQQSLLARAEEEMVAKEQAELEQLVGDLAVKERQLLAELRRDRDGVTLETWSSLSRVERTAVVWFVAKEKVTKWKEKKGKERRGGEGRGTACTPRLLA